VKRKFQFCERLFVMDEQQRGHSYSTAELARLLLRKLIGLAEDALGQEIHNVGLSFPTKWSARVRSRLEAVTRELAARLREERKPYRVSVLPPRLDEANAVALNLLTSAHGREDLPETFYLIAYDFGGGTVDTSALEVYLPHDVSALRTRFVGIGGRNDFGGDDVTRAVMTRLRDRITDALQRRPVVLDTRTQKSARLLEIPLVADGEPLRGDTRGAAPWHQLGRKNWDALWRVAELVKIDLCERESAALAPAPAPRKETALVAGPAAGGDVDFGDSLIDLIEDEERRQHEADGRHPAVDRLAPRLGEIACRVLIEPGPGEGGQAVEVVWTLDSVLDPLDLDARNAFFAELRLTLDEACDWPLDDLFETNGGRRYTVRQRVEETVRELKEQCQDRQVEPHVIVLAGGGCRLPLVARLMRQYFPSDRDLLLFSKDFAKRRVAHGLASYLALRQVIDLDGQLARAADTVHHPLGVQRLVSEKRTLRAVFETVVPVGAPLASATAAHAFRFSAGQILTGPDGG
jgi:hypothetical protein